MGGEIEDRLVKEIEDRESKIRELEIETEEAVQPKGSSNICSPSKEEYEKHCLNPLPYRNWCPVCVQAKARNPQHYRIPNSRGIPVFSIDYMFLKGKESLSFPVLVITESESGGIWAIPVRRKGNYSDYVSHRIASVIERVGYA